MIVRRTLSLIAVAFVLMVAVGTPATAATDPNYPVTGGPGTTAVEGTKAGTPVVEDTTGGTTVVEGTTGGTTAVRGTKTENTRTPTGVSGAGLARTGGELGTLWVGLALLVGGGLIVTASRNRRKVLA